MKFGLFCIAPWHESLSAEQVLLDTMEQIEMADKLGLDEVWLGEHRFSRHGLLSGFFSFVGNVAARTQHVRIGTAVIVLPLHSPILVAEEIAMLDVLSGGRIEVGIGSGYQRQEFEGLGVDMNESRERFREAVEVIVKAWTEETLTYHGKFTHVDNIWVQTDSKTPSAPLCGDQHQPVHGRMGRESTNTANLRRSHRQYGTSPTSVENVAREDGRVWPPPRPPDTTDGEGHLCSADDGRGPQRSDRLRGFLLAHSTFIRHIWRDDRHARRQTWQPAAWI